LPFSIIPSTAWEALCFAYGDFAAQGPAALPEAERNPFREQVLELADWLQILPQLFHAAIRTR